MARAGRWRGAPQHSAWRRSGGRRLADLSRHPGRHPTCPHLTRAVGAAPGASPMVAPEQKGVRRGKRRGPAVHAVFCEKPPRALRAGAFRVLVAWPWGWPGDRPALRFTTGGRHRFGPASMGGARRARRLVAAARATLALAAEPNRLNCHPGSDRWAGVPLGPKRTWAGF